MVRVYVTDITEIPDPLESPKLFERLSEERQSRIKKMKQVKSRKQSLGAGLLLEAVLNLYGLSSDAVWVDSFGKPEIEGLHFNLSHSGDMVVCAVSDKPVGCDIEKIRKEPKGVAKRFFAKSEQGDFFRLWTIKESYIKMTGEGLRLPLNDFEVILDSEIKLLRDGKVQDCSVKEYTIPGYRISVCAMEKEFAGELEELKIE